MLKKWVIDFKNSFWNGSSVVNATQNRDTDKKIIDDCISILNTVPTEDMARIWCELNVFKTPKELEGFLTVNRNTLITVGRIMDIVKGKTTQTAIDKYWQTSGISGMRITEKEFDDFHNKQPQ